MTNREKFRSIFGVYAEEFWAYPKDKMLDWLQYDVPEANVGDMISRQDVIDAFADWFNGTENTIMELTFSECKSVIEFLPSAQQCKYWDSESNYCALNRQEDHEPSMEEFMYGQDMGNPEDGSL